MRNIFLIIVLTIAGTYANAQRGIKVGYVDMDYILENVPEYQQATQQLEQKAQQWKAELESKFQEIKDMKDALANERALLTNELIEEREEEIAFEEKQVQALQAKRFGANGDLVTQKRQIIQPVEDQVFNAIQEIGQRREYDFIFENSASALLLYSANRHDLSDQVLQMIGRQAKKNKIADNNSESDNDDEENDDESLKIVMPYKSVQQAREEKEKKEEREAKIQAKKEERQEKIEAQQTHRDSLRAERQRQFEERRKRALEKRQQRKDSIKQARENRNK